MTFVVHVTETEFVPLAAYSRDALSYFDPPTGHHASYAASAVTDVQAAAAGVDMKYLPIEASPSVVTLLNDKLDSQTKATIICLQFSSPEMHGLLDNIHPLL